VLGEEARAERRHDIIVQVVEPVGSALERSFPQELLEPERLRRGQECEQGPFVLGELPEQRPEDNRSQRVQRMAGR
jgi:hypothetical protein